MRAMIRATLVLAAMGALARCETAGAAPGDDVDRVQPQATIRRVAYQRSRAAGRFTVRWLGQDGHDFVGPHNRLEPSDTQDIHLLLGGLDPRRQVAFIDVVPQGEDRWQFNAQSVYWKAELKRNKGAATADLYIEPNRVEDGRVFHVLVRYDDNSTVEADVRSRHAEPSLPVPSAAIQARWVGQDGQDRTGVGPAVGPDGLQDVRIHLSKLSRTVNVKAVRIDSSSGSHWESGRNPQLLSNAELVKDPKDPGQGDLFFQPDRDLSKHRLKITVLYENDRRQAATVAANRCDPNLRVAQAPLPKVEEWPLTVQWLGQDGSNPSRGGDVHVVLGGLSAKSRPQAVALTDSVRGAWLYRPGDRVPGSFDGTPGTLEVKFRPDRATADLFFTPYRDAADDQFTVRLVGADGRIGFGRFAGGHCDLGRLQPAPAATKVDAQPGQDLQSLVDRYGTVVLGQGTYRLTHPLVLNRPVHLNAPDGAVLVFAQDGNDPPWTTAIKVRCGNTTVEGFSVRFEGPIRWNKEVAYGAAVIGMTDNFEPGYNDLKSNVAFRRLDLEIPPADDPSKWVEAMRLFRMIGAASGTIAGNRLRGGPIEFFHGPWSIVDNEFIGTPPGTYSHGFAVGHNTHDVEVRGNRLSSPPPSGKTWRFLVFTGSSARDRIVGNTVVGIGARDDDTIPWSNEPEIILTEGYALRYEGKVLATSPDGKILRISQPQNGDFRVGDVVSILSGPAAGQWRQISQMIEPTTFLLDRPLPKGTEHVSITSGYVSQLYERNRIDIRGGRRSDSFVLAGNQFGTRVVNNHLIGGGLAFRMMACPTEQPVAWGWSHAPFLGGVIEANILEDCEQGGVVGVEHSQYIKLNKGRTYMSVQLRGNVVRWTGPFLARMQRSADAGPVPGLTIGYEPSIDPYELMVAAEGNTLDAPPGFRDIPALLIHAANFNSQKVLNRRIKLPAGVAPPASGRREARSSELRPVR